LAECKGAFCIGPNEKRSANELSKTNFGNQERLWRRIIIRLLRSSTLSCSTSVHGLSYHRSSQLPRMSIEVKKEIQLDEW